MNHLFRSTQRALVFLFSAVALALICGVILWLVLDAFFGFHIPLMTVLVGIALLTGWTAMSGRSAERAAPPPPPQPRRVATWQDARHMAVLHKQGLIPGEQLDATLRELLPPPPVAPGGDRRHRGGR